MKNQVDRRNFFALGSGALAFTGLAPAHSMAATPTVVPFLNVTDPPFNAQANGMADDFRG
jgi:hypothetical protein